MPRSILEPICQIRSASRGAVRVALLIHRIILDEGDSVASIDSDGQVYVTPAAHDFSQALIQKYADCVVGHYNAKATAQDIRDDILAWFEEQQRSAA
jgi:hypothetical protein